MNPYYPLQVLIFFYFLSGILQPIHQLHTLQSSLLRLLLTPLYPHDSLHFPILSGNHTIQFYCTNCHEQFVTNDYIEYFRKNYKSAIDNYSTFLSVYPEHQEASENLANVYTENKTKSIVDFEVLDYQAALEIYTIALKGERK